MPHNSSKLDPLLSYLRGLPQEDGGGRSEGLQRIEQGHGVQSGLVGLEACWERGMTLSVDILEIDPFT